MAQWTARSLGHVTGIGWRRWLDRGQPLDPYLIWADLTAFLGFDGWRRDDPRHRDSLALLVQLCDQGLPAPLPGQAAGPDGAACGSVDPVFGLLDVPGIYRDRDGNGAIRFRYRHVTGRVAPNALEQLLCSAAVTRFVLGLPRLPATDRNPVARDLRAGTTVVLGFIDDGCPFAHPDFRRPGDTGSRVVALWDQDPARRPVQGWRSPPAFGYGGSLDARAIADACRQDPRFDRPLAPYRHVDYVPVRPERDRHAVSTQGGSVTLPVGTLQSATHGAAVMQLAMGPEPPWRRSAAAMSLGDDRDLHRRALQGPDAAAGLAAVFVQLPTATVMDTSGGSLGVHVLDGAHFIIDQAQSVDPGTLQPGPQRFDNRIVLNISYGAIAGPHDGSSIIEEALRELVESAEAQKLWIVVSAGNAHRSRTHARLRLEPGRSGFLTWQVPPDHPHESFLEVWLPDHDEQGAALDDKELDRFRISITSPDGTRLVEATAGAATLLERAATGAAADVIAGLVFPRQAAQTGTRARMALVVVAPTCAPRPGDAPPRALGHHGLWTIEVHRLAMSGEAAAKGTPVHVHAWTERNDLLYGTRRGQQAHVWGDDPDPEPTEFTRAAMAARRGPHEPAPRAAMALAPDFSLGTLAGSAPSRDRFWKTGRFGSTLGAGTVLTVGAYRLSDGEMAAYSSAGPDRRSTVDAMAQALHGAFGGNLPQDPSMRLRPDVDAPGDIGSAATGLPAPGMLAGRMMRISGTSAAAPTVARLIANALAGGPEPGGGPSGSIVLPDAALPDPALAPARGTPTPARDDAFRRGRTRVR